MLGGENMKKLFFSAKVLSATAFVLTMLANISSASACGWMNYQPETPKSLLK